MTPSLGNAGAGREAPTVLMACNDLMFVVRVQSIAKGVGYGIRAVRPAERLPAGDVLVVNIGDRVDWTGTIRDAAEKGMPVIGFGPHSDTEGRRAAKEAGAGRVLSNGNLVRDLPAALTELKSVLEHANAGEAANPERGE